MAYRICKSIELESGHLLSKHPGNCKFPHGHTRSVEMVFRADTLDANDMVVDFKAVKQMMGDFLQQFDHSLCVNTDDPNYAAFVAAYGERIIPFDREDPTSEVMGPHHFQLRPACSGKGQGRFRRIPRAGLRHPGNACACGRPAVPGRNTENRSAGYSFRHAFRRECRFNRISRFSFQDGYPVAGQFPRIRSAEAYPLKGVE